MFREAIETSPLVNEAADAVLSNIGGDNFRGDISTVATLRCFFGKRIGKDETLTARISEYHASGIDPLASETEICNKIYAAMSLNECDTGVLHIISLSSQKETNDTIFDALSHNFTKQFKSYKENTGIEAFYKGFRLLCYYDEEHRSVALFVGNLNYRKLHFLQAAFLPMFPWFKNGEHGKTTDLDVELIKTLTSDDAAAYTAIVKKFAAQYDFRGAQIKKLLGDFEARCDKELLAKTESEIQEIDNEVDSHHRAIESRLANRNDLLIRRLGLETKIANGDGSSELTDYFLCNKRLSVVNTRGSKVTFITTDYLSYFDKDAAETALKNPRSTLCSGGDGVTALLKAVLIDEKLRIRFASMFTLNISGGISANGGVNFADYGIADCIANPHLYHYSCLGNNERFINEAIRKRDYVGAIEQCVAANKNWNILDSAVSNRFVDDLRAKDVMCIELPDGRVVTPKKAIDWLKGNGDTNEKKETEE